MGVDSWIKFKIRKRLEECVDVMCMQLSEKIAELALSRSVEEIMRVIEEILLYYISCLPIDEEYFYFCQLTKCEECLYAKLFGKCDDVGSLWSTIEMLKTSIMYEIEMNIYAGEIYGSVDSKALKELINNFIKWEIRIYYYLKQKIDLLEKRQTVEGVNEEYFELLYLWVDMLPVSVGYRYFCLERNVCEECEFGKNRGICGDKNSVYGKIQKKREKLLKVLFEQAWFWHRKIINNTMR